MDDLVDTTEMYLKSVLELEEAKVSPLRARIAERLAQSPPTVTQTVARMEKAGLVGILPDRTLQLTSAGKRRAVSVMRKHRITECFLAGVVGLEWTRLHEEACRWEHVISDVAGEKMAALVGDPAVSPYGNPIPPAGHHDWDCRMSLFGTTNLVRLLIDHGRPVEARIAWIGEAGQARPELLGVLAQAGVLPGAVARFESHGPSVLVEVEGRCKTVELGHRDAAQLFVDF